MILNMFRASLCSSSGGQFYIYSIWYRHTLYAAIQCTDYKKTLALQVFLYQIAALFLYNFILVFLY
jgi:hypothetical protein